MSEPSVPPRLTIQIPQYKSYDYLIKRLRWLETPECRATMQKDALTLEKRLTTEEFRRLLKFEDNMKRLEMFNVYD